MSKYLNTILLFFIVTSNAYAGPSVKETIDYINQVITDSQKSSNVSIDDSYGWTTEYEKPYFYLKDKCNVEIRQDRVGGKGWTDKDRYVVSLENYSLVYEKGYQNKGEIALRDRDGLKRASRYRIHTTWKGKRLKEEKISEANEYLYIDLHGVYKEKINKALKHLSETCYQKYGDKQKELF